MTTSTYRELANNHDIIGQCTNCGEKITFCDIAEEIRNSSLEEVICQNCWNKSE